MIDHEDQPILRHLSVFSGLGGMDVGLERAGFTNVGTIEFDALAKEALRLNRPDWRSIGTGDVMDVAKWLSAKDLSLDVGDLDLLSGGPPCQPFSTASLWSSNGRRGMQDDRARTLHALTDLINRIQPKFVLIENVLGFVQGPGSALPYLKSRLRASAHLSKAGYELTWRLYNAADIGVPQNRRRVIVILRRRDQPQWSWPKPTHADSPLTAWDALHDLKSTEIPSPSGSWTGLLPSIPEGENYQWLTSHGGGEEVFGYRTKYWSFLLKLSKAKPSWTLAASPGPATGPFHWDNRPLSVQEMLRLQSFPDDWKVPGDYRSQVRLIGNATPPLLAETVGLRIRQLITGHAAAPTLLRGRGPTPPMPTAPIPVAETYRNLVGKKEAHAGEGAGPAARTKPGFTTPE